MERDVLGFIKVLTKKGPVMGLAMSGSVLLGCADSASPTVAPTQSYGPEFSQPMSDKLRLGRLLELLNFRSLPNEARIQPNQLYTADRKLFVWKLSLTDELVVQEQRLKALTNFCGLHQLPIGFAVLFVGEIEGGQEASVIPSPDGRAMQVFLSEGAHRRLAQKELEEKYEVAPEKRQQALETLTNVKLNATLARMLCLAVDDERLYRQGASRQQKERVYGETEARFADYDDRILNQAVLPVVLIRSKAVD